MLALAAALLLSKQVLADTWNEQTEGDAQDDIVFAQVTSGPGTLNSIFGTLSSGDDVDVFQIFIPEPSLFSARTFNGDSEGPQDFDAGLALFDSEGLGVYYNDDLAVNDGDAALPAASVVGPQVPGIYYIAVFDSNFVPLSGAAASLNDIIFPLVDPPFTAVVGPTGPGGSLPLAGFGSETTKGFSNEGYQIELLGANFANDTTPAGPIVSSVLPASRSVQVGNAATAFATIINSGGATATDCSIAPPPGVAADFTYQTTNASNLPVGTADTPADILPGGSQSFVFGFTPNAPIPSTDVQLIFDCTNTDAASSSVGLNTLLLVADSNPVPDIVALAATPTEDGIADLSPTGVFSVASVNVGVSGSITVSVELSNPSLPVSVGLCQTDPATFQCINPAPPALPAATVDLTIGANETPTFSFFITSSGNVPTDLANNRLFVRFVDAGGITRGATSVAIRTP